MEIEVGRGIRFVPAGWSDGGPNMLPAFMQKDVVGRIESVSQERNMFRVSYEAKGVICHECFKLPKIATDKWKLLKG